MDDVSRHQFGLTSNSRAPAAARTTVAVTRIMARSFAAARIRTEASCTNRNEDPEQKTITTINPPENVIGDGLCRGERNGREDRQQDHEGGSEQALTKSLRRV